jgi:Phage portal protein, SPP1 Gp6-like
MDYKAFFAKHDAHPRFSNYVGGKKLYIGKHREAFGVAQYEMYANPNVEYIVANYHQILTDSLTNLIFGEEPMITFKDEKTQKWWDEYARSDSFYIKIRQLGETASYSGDAAIQITTDEDKVEIFELENECWYPIYNPNNPSLGAEGHIKKIKIEINKKVCWMVEVHTDGKIEYMVLDKDYQDMGQEVAAQWFGKILVDPDEQVSNFKLVDNHGCGNPLIFNLKNNSIKGEYFGLSDYTIGLNTKVNAINQIINQNQDILKKHADPKMVVPKNLVIQIKSKLEEIKKTSANKLSAYDLGVDEKNGITKMARSKMYENMFDDTMIKKLRYLGVDVEDVKPEYITWDAKLEQSFLQISNLEKMIHQESGLAKILVNPEMATGAASGVAILRMAQPTISKAQKKISYLKDTLQQLIYTILELANKRLKQGVSPEYPTITFQDGLINDVKETLDEQVIMLTEGITSKVEAIMAVRSTDKENALAVLDVIAKENDLFDPVAPTIKPK